MKKTKLNKPLSILQIGDWEFGENGIATLVYNFNQYLDTDKVIFDYIIANKIKNNSYKENIERKKSKIYELNISKKGISKKIYLFVKLINFLKNNKYEIVHIHESTAYMMLYYSFICKIVGIKNIILHSHSSGFDSGSRKLKKIIHSISKMLLPLFTKNYLACSKVAAQWTFLEKYLNKVVIVNNGIETKKFRFNLIKRNEIRKQLGIENNFVLGHIGRMSYQKNHKFLIELFKEVKKNIPESKLLLIGTGPLEDKLKLKVKEMKLEKDILFLGLKNNVEDYFQIMDLFLLPSHFEGLPIVGIEGQASGLTCLVSSCVSEEIKITNLCKFLSLENMNSWLKEIKLERNNYLKKQREKYFLEVGKSGYDIKKSTEKLMETYYIIGNIF